MHALILIAFLSPHVREEIAFSRLTGYWQTTFPGNSFEGLGIRMSDGPRGTRLHVDIPVDVEKSYLFHFSAAFIQRKLKSRSQLDQRVADDLLQLRQPLLLTYSSTHSLDGRTYMRCRTYVVETNAKPKR